MKPIQFKVGDKVVNDIFKTFRGYPYVITITAIEPEFGIIHFIHERENNLMEATNLRFATKSEKFFGPIYDFFFK
jgi:hypothetical protein